MISKDCVDYQEITGNYIDFFSEFCGSQHFDFAFIDTLLTSIKKITNLFLGEARLKDCHATIN